MCHKVWVVTGGMLGNNSACPREFWAFSSWMRGYKKAGSCFQDLYGLWSSICIIIYHAYVLEISFRL